MPSLLDLQSKIEAPAVAMSHPTEVAIDGVGTVPTPLGAGVLLRKSTVAEEAHPLSVTAPGRTAFMLSAGVTFLWRRNFLATPTTLLNNTLVLISRNMTISPSKPPVLEFQIPLPPSGTPRLTPFS
jgi:hypothetical protein